MADDIVEVLRKGGHKINEHHCKVCDEFCYASELCDCCYDALNSATQAADEIERLRALGDALYDALAWWGKGNDNGDAARAAWQEARRD